MFQDLPMFDPEIAAEFGTPSAAATSGIFSPVMDVQGIVLLLVHFVANLLVCWILIQFFYYRKSKRRDYYFTFILFSVTIFLLLYLLDSVKIQVGLTLGLFAIFGIIRYRTEMVPIREMTYLFMVIGISVINGLGAGMPLMVLGVTNILFILATWAMESTTFLSHVSYKMILYDKIDLIQVGRENDLKADLEARTGLRIDRVEVGHIDFLRDAAYVKVYYHPGSSQISTIDTMIKLKQFNDDENPG